MCLLNILLLYLYKSICVKSTKSKKNYKNELARAFYELSSSSTFQPVKVNELSLRSVCKKELHVYTIMMILNLAKRPGR
ncbi:hypothetical protein Hanom_Chr15g01352311 [Helianthus anomalus]